MKNKPIFQTDVINEKRCIGPFMAKDIDGRRNRNKDILPQYNKSDIKITLRVLLYGDAYQIAFYIKILNLNPNGKLRNILVHT